MKPEITLRPKEIERCLRYGQDVVDSYTRGDNPNSLAVSGNRGAQFNVDLQARGRMAEWVVCKLLGIYPGTLNWTMKPDPGYDIMRDQLRIDVKMTRHPNGLYLVWPIEIRHIYQQKKFDVLFFVRGMPPTFTVGGWVTKDRFWSEHQEAPDGHQLEPGTWFMPEVDLDQMDAFYQQFGRWHHFEHYCHCGEWGSYGFGVSLRTGRPGTWYCGKHLPK